MKKALFLTFLFTTTLSFSFAIPKKLIGRYETHIPDFEFQDNGRTVQAAGYNIAISLKEDYLWYYCGNLEFYGTFTKASESGDLVDISVNVSNDLSVQFDLELSLNKKTKSIAVKGLKGIPEVNLYKREIVVKRKS